MVSNSSRTVTIQLPEDSGGRLPYPWHVIGDGDSAGDVKRQDVWEGNPARLAGFQRSSDVQHVDLLTRDWLAGDVEAAVGMFPVFIDADGGMWNLTVPIDDCEEEQ